MHLHAQQAILACKYRLRRVQMQHQAAHIGMPGQHACQRTACEQKGEQIAHIELEIDRSNQHHQHRERQHAARRRGQDVDIALGQ